MKQDYTDVLKVVGIDSMGYGKIPKLVMKDRRLTPEAKCIYGYFASYAGSGNSAFPTVSRIIYDLCMSETRYYKHFKLLTHYGYISVEQVKVKGKFTHNLYNLNMEIVEEKPSPQNEGTEKPSTRFEGTVNECTGNEGTNNNSSKNNNFNNNNCNSQSVSQSAEKKLTDGPKDDDKELDEFMKILEVLDEEYLKQQGIGETFLNSLEGCLRQLYFSKDGFEVGKSVIPQRLVRQTLKNLTPYCIEFTYTQFDKYTREKEIPNPNGYLQTILYNSVYDERISMQADVNYNVFGNGRNPA